MKESLKFINRIAIISCLLFILIVLVLPNNRPTLINQAPKTIEQLPTLSEENGSIFNTPEQKETAIPLQNSGNDCLVTYQGRIYNISGFFGSHPGGDAPLLKYCGQDMTTAFESKDKNPPIPHSKAAMTMLDQYLVQ